MEPSEQDIEVTMRVKHGMELMGLKLHDHIIVARNQALSLAEMGKIPATPMPKMNRMTGEKATGYHQAAKPPSIKQQIAFAEEQLSRESKTTSPQKKTHDRGDR